MKIFTLFTPGAYGTFISWCVYSFSELNVSSDAILPVIEYAGSAHGFRNTPGIDLVRPTHDIVEESLTNPKLNYILIECDKEKIINYIDNQFQKQNLSDTLTYLNTFYPEFSKKLKTVWGNTETWALRELLSFFLNEMIANTKHQIENFHAQVQQNNCYRINPENFLLDVENELEKLLLFFNLKKNSNFNLLNYHVSEFLELQQNFNKNFQIDKFVDDTINNKECYIPNLTIFDEAWIQYKLRMKGIEIKCYNLNKFPNNSIDLNKLLE
jgi:uncharacterized protein YozE (UPF0346 family)